MSEAAVLIPQPVLQISTGATAKLQGQFAYALSGIDPKETYATAKKLMAKLNATQGIFSSGNGLNFSGIGDFSLSACVGG